MPVHWFGCALNHGEEFFRFFQGVLCRLWFWLFGPGVAEGLDQEVPVGGFFIGPDLGGGGEVASFGVVGHFGHGLDLLFGVGFREEAGGDLEAVEEVAGAPGVDVVAGDALEDLAECELDGRAIFEFREGKGGAAAAAGAGVFDRAAGGVVVVAEVLVAEAG